MRNGFTEKDFNAVGPGWRFLLEALNSQMVGTIQSAVNHATVVKEEYRDKECEANAGVRVVQVKEKFGGLRVYWESNGLGSRLRDQLYGAAHLTESLSYKICEKCGSMGHFRGPVETRNKRNTKFGRVLTLCGSCHEERDNLDAAARFEFDNGDWTV